MHKPEPLVLFSECAYTTFCSHAAMDDRAWRGWITDFKKELEEGLNNRIHKHRVPKAFMSTDKPLVQGLLGDELKSAVRTSFAMFVFVHDGYLESQWCLRELEFFRDLFGDQGPRQRLYVIAMSEPAIQELKAKPEWRRCVPDDAVVVPFWDKDENVEPVKIYANDSRRIIVSTDFWRRFVPVQESLVRKIKASISSEAAMRAMTYPTSRAAEPGESAKAADDTVRVFIEGNDKRAYFEGLSAQIADCWDKVDEVQRIRPPLYLRPTGIDLDDTAKRPVLDNANGIVLVWEDDAKTPEALVAQINLMEPALLGPQAPPGLVAYLMPPGEDAEVPQAIMNWPVVRFEADRANCSVSSHEDDRGTLNRFLKRVLKHARR